MIDRIDAADPDAMPFIILLTVLIVAGTLFLAAQHKTGRRNRWLPDPKPDDRDSVRKFRDMHKH